MRNYNEEAFSPDEVEKGLHMDLLKTLLSINSKREGEAYYDIHITFDGYCTIIQWTTVIEGFTSGFFEFVDENQHIMTEIFYPDNSSEIVFPDDVESTKKEWYEAHPDWNK